MSKILGGMIPGYRSLCLLSSAVTLILLGLWWSQESDTAKFSGTKNEHLPIPRATNIPSKGPDAPPVLAYWILGSRGDSKRVLRLLKAVYHPRNQYLLHLDSSSPLHERMELALGAHSQTVFQEFGNVNVVGESYPVNQLGASGLAAMLHAAALLLRLNANWDWFIPLTPSDYPMYTPDEILYAFTSVPRGLNFVGYTNDTTCNESPNARQIAVDPSLYLRDKMSVSYAAETREEPDSFQIFRGSPWMMLSRVFLEHCVSGWDNLPRKLLMYFSNVAFPLQSYFQTVLCNTPEFQNTTVNHNLKFIIPKEDSPRALIRDQVMASHAIFAGPLTDEDETHLQEINDQILDRDPDRLVFGKWCTKTRLVNETTPAGSNSTGDGEDYSHCSVWGNIDEVEPGPRGTMLKRTLSQVVEEKKSMSGGLCQGHALQNEQKND